MGSERGPGLSWHEAWVGGWAGSVAAPPHITQCFLSQAAGQEQHHRHQAASALSLDSSNPRQVGVDEVWPPEIPLPLLGTPGTQSLAWYVMGASSV